MMMTMPQRFIPTFIDDSAADDGVGLCVDGSCSLEWDSSNADGRRRAVVDGCADRPAGGASGARGRGRRRRRRVPTATTRQIACTGGRNLPLLLALLLGFAVGCANGVAGPDAPRMSPRALQNQKPSPQIMPFEAPCEGRMNQNTCENTDLGFTDIDCLWVGGVCLKVSPDECEERTDEGECQNDDRCEWVAGTAFQGGACITAVECEDRTNYGQCKNDPACQWMESDFPQDGECITIPVLGIAYPPSGSPVASPVAAPEPSPGPSPAPVTDAPTMRPVVAPTTAEPTRQPVQRPTTSEPTDPPTDEPSRRPTAKPTEAPTKEPTMNPSKSPSIRPTPPPTRMPTRKPTDRPTERPSDAPTVDPTKSPSRSPTYRPTDVPTDDPTQNPTLSHRPTPLIWPSASPTISSMPTPSPTEFPTASPSESPTKRPTKSPTNRPTSSPVTPGPTDADVVPSEPTEPPPAPDTPSPVSGPALPPRMKYTVSSSLMVLNGAEQLEKDGASAWIEETEGRIYSATKKIIEEYDGQELAVTVEWEDQEELSGRRILAHSQEASAASASVDSEMPSQYEHLRKLQSSSLQITFTTTIEFNSEYDDWDANEMVAAGFITVSQQNEYIYSLKVADEASFGTVNSMALNVDGEIVTDPSPVVKHPPPPPDYTIYYIIGGVVGGALLLLVVMVVVYKRRSSSSSSHSSSSSPHKSHKQDTHGLSVPPKNPSRQDPNATLVTAQSTAPQSYFGTIEPHDGPDDVSTLGDPYFGEVVAEPAADATVGESMISSEQQMYEYGVKRNRLNTGGSTLNQSTVTGGMYSKGNVFVDDGTLEGVYRTPNASQEEDGTALRRLTVVAPSGKLGIVIDNQTGDMPIVHAIKETSALKGRVCVGDLLISVDEVDCRGMTAVQVSKLISSRSRNPDRTLVLLRGSGGC